MRPEQGSLCFAVTCVPGGNMTLKNALIVDLSLLLLWNLLTAPRWKTACGLSWPCSQARSLALHYSICPFLWSIARNLKETVCSRVKWVTMTRNTDWGQPEFHVLMWNQFIKLFLSNRTKSYTKALFKYAGGNIKWAAEKPQLSAQVAFDDSVFWLVKSMVLLVRFGDFVLFPSFHSILN